MLLLLVVLLITLCFFNNAEATTETRKTGHVYAEYMYSRFFYDILHYYKDFWKSVEMWYIEKELYGW